MRTVASLEGVVVPATALSSVPLFEGLGPDELMTAATSMRFREFPAGATICREGEPGSSMLVLVEGLAHALVALPEEPELRSRSVFVEGRLVAKLRHGDVIGVMSLISGEPHPATVKAAVPMAALELDEQAFRALIAKSPGVLVNLARVLGGQLATATRRQAERGRRGEAVALVAGPSLTGAIPDIVAATEAATPRSVRAFDTRESVEAALDGLDDALREHATVLLIAELGQEGLSLLAEHVDRAVALLAAREGELPPAFAESAPLVELALVGNGDRGRTTAFPGADGARVVRRMTSDADAPAGVPAADVAWLGRHLARTKLGLALGAGGAKGYAHVGALQVLEEAGYVVDCVGGASIGAIVAAYVALGMEAAEIERTLNDAFTPEAVEKIFSLSLTGKSTGVELITRVFRETTAERSFEETLIPLVCMAVDLTARSSAPIRDGPIWEGLRASTALAGMFPPYEHDGHRLVDGVALIPVPTGSVAEDGADITLSVNLMSRETLRAWPGEEPPPPEAAKPGSRMLETLLEVMDLSQLDTSIRHAELADVVVTPRFGPGSWRDFHLSEQFLEAGREAMKDKLARLRSLARPQTVVQS
ncbi:MAG: patatin-like phospholipase family protein [Solirubrobacterales bacterium]